MSTVISDRRFDASSSNSEHSSGRHPASHAVAWVQAVTLAVLFALLFWPNLRRLWDKTNPITGEDNWKHAIFVPLIGLYYLYVNREQILAAKAKTAWSGLAITLFGILFFTYGIWPGQNDWFKDMGMVVTLFGVVTLMAGWQIMKTVWFPIVFLVCALPWPGLFYSMLAGPLQQWAAEFAVRVLSLIGVPAMQSGTKLFITDGHNVVRTLNVAEACAGLRSLMTFVAIAAAVGFLSTFRPLWQKIIITLSAIPIAITCNMLRVTVQGVVTRYGDPQWAESFAHGFLGLAMMIPAFFLILLVGWVLQNIFIEEVDDKASLRARSIVRPSSATGQPQATVAATGSAAKPGAVVRPAAAPLRTPPPAMTRLTAPPPPTASLARPGARPGGIGSSQASGAMPPSTRPSEGKS